MATASAPSTCQGSWWASTYGLRIVVLCTAASVALHALLLTLRLPVLSPVVQRLQGALGESDLIRGRVVSPPAASFSPEPFIANAGGLTPARAEKLHKAPASEANPPASRTAPTPEEASNPPSVLRPSVGQPAAGDAEAGTALSTTTPAPSSDASDSYYVPRPLLSVTPIAKQAVLLAAPPEAAMHGRYVGILSLFIDEQGRVQRITFDEPSLPEAFERAARETFAAAQFTPGEIDGTAVKSRLRIEVIFDETP